MNFLVTTPDYRAYAFSSRTAYYELKMGRECIEYAICSPFTAIKSIYQLHFYAM
jgi:hypothetical protein